MKKVGLFIILAVFLGCDTHHPRPAALSPKYTPNIEIGQTSRKEILFEFGVPSTSFNNGRILTFRLVRGLDKLENPGVDYRIQKAKSGDVKARIWSASQFNLVVVFNENQKVEKWKLLQIR